MNDITKAARAKREEIAGIKSELDRCEICIAAVAETKAALVTLKQQRKELQTLLNKISPVNKALDELDTIQESLSKFRSKGLVDDEDLLGLRGNTPCRHAEMSSSAQQGLPDSYCQTITRQ